MSEQQTPPQAPKKRTNKVAEEKAALRAKLATLVNRVPDKVNTGGVQTTRQWVTENTKSSRDVTRSRISRNTLREAVARMEGWLE